MKRSTLESAIAAAALVFGAFVVGRISSSRPNAEAHAAPPPAIVEMREMGPYEYVQRQREQEAAYPLELAAWNIKKADGVVNPAIDMEGFLRVAREAAKNREARRVTEADFLRMSREPGTIVLDARSREGFDSLHIKGAVNLSFPDIAIDSIKQVIPDKSTRVLIYCNNNFWNAPRPFPPKDATASLNLSTYIALFNYGYKNVYELGPLIDINKSILPFESSPQEPLQPEFLRR